MAESFVEYFGRKSLTIMSTSNPDIENALEEIETPEIDSKYRLIILAAKRSKQLQRGARPRIDIDPAKHKPTRIALEEVMRGRVNFSLQREDGEEPE